MRPLTIAELSAATTTNRRTVNDTYPSAVFSKLAGIKTAFLCHSHKDQTLALKLIALFAERRVDLYVDWMDSEMPSTPTRETASRIQAKIEELDLFLYLATSNSSNSSWCPWEIGYGDKAKGKETLFIIPTQDGSSVFGQEYLSLYRSLQVDELIGFILQWDPVAKRESIWLP